MGSDRVLVTIALNQFQIKHLDDLKLKQADKIKLHTVYCTKLYIHIYISLNQHI